MKLEQLLHNVGASTLPENIEITALCRDSRKVTQGCAFVCIKGTGIDSHQFAADAVAGGAAVVVVERDLGLPNQIIVPNTRTAWGRMSANWFGHPSERLHLIGVTGTNGKTSTTYLLKAILEQAGHKVGLIGTVRNLIGDQEIAAGHTTPDAYDLQQMFAQMADAHCDYAVMEISSHALDQGRVEGCRFDAGIFTNLTQDHLDYHGTMENYAAAKKRLFSLCDTAILNKDDPWYATMSDGLPCPAVTYSAADVAADYVAHNICERADGITFELVTLNAIGRVSLATPGRFSVYNATGAAACANTLGIPFETVTQALSSAAGVTGRAEVVRTNRDFTVVIDYAHTPDGLVNICNTLNTCKVGRLVTVFGCGGDRDRTKRPKMGAAAAQLSDFVVVTSDNPRSEDPEAIIRDILPGVLETGKPHTVIPDRIQAIHWAITNAQAGDTILLAGKGHETYQVLKEGTVHLDEREIVADALRALPNKER